MCGKDSFENFVKFVECKNRLHGLEEKLNFLKSEIEKISDGVEQKKQRISDLELAVKSLKGEVFSYEIESKANKQRMLELKQRLEETSSAREYEGYRKEIGELERIQSRCDLNLAQIWKSYEAVQEEKKEESKDLESWLSVQDQLIKEKKTEKEKLEKGCVELQASCEKLEVGVSEDKLAEYNEMKAVVADPVVPMRGTLCSVCNFQISQRDLSLIKKGGLVTCKNCYRLLYRPRD